MNPKVRNSLLLLFLLAQLVFPVAGGAAPAAQQPTPESRAQALLEQMSPEERVGQLFLVTFEGREVVEDSPIYNLISNHLLRKYLL